MPIPHVQPRLRVHVNLLTGDWSLVGGHWSAEVAAIYARRHDPSCSEAPPESKTPGRSKRMAQP